MILPVVYPDAVKMFFYFYFDENSAKKSSLFVLYIKVVWKKIFLEGLITKYLLIEIFLN